MSDEMYGSNGFRADFLHDERRKLIKGKIYFLTFTISGYVYTLQDL